MVEIKNPYSRKRFTTKEKLERKFTKYTIPFIKKLPLSEKKKFVPESLHRLREAVAFWNTDTWANGSLKDVDVNLLSVIASEYIPIENVDKLNKGLKRLFKRFPPKTYLDTNDPSRIDEFCDKAKQSIHERRWSNFGHLEITSDLEFSNYVNRIWIRGTQIASSSIVLEFIIYPSNNFLEQHKKIIESNVEEEHVLMLKLSKLFRFWGSKNYMGSQVKESLLEDMLLEIKWRTLKEMEKYFTMYFTQHNVVAPSVEVYKIKQISCVYKRAENKNMNDFWWAIGMDAFDHEISKDGYWSIFSASDEGRLDNSIKIICNSEIPRREGYYSLDFQIIASTAELSKICLPILVMRTYVLDLSKRIAIRQKRTFNFIKKVKPKYKKLINIRYELEQNVQILRRFKNEAGENYFRRIRVELRPITNYFEPARPRLNRDLWANHIVDSTIYLIDKTYEHSQNFAKIIDDTVRLLEIKTNNSLRKRTFWLTIFTVILSVIATVIAATSLYLQLTDEKKLTIVKILHAIKNFFS